MSGVCSWARPPPAALDPDHPPEPDKIDDAGLTVLVLSGTEPGAKRQLAGTAADACDEGLSPGCVGAALRARVAQGYGVWVVTALMEFNGKYVTDVTPDKRVLGQIQTHVQGLKLVGRGDAKRYQGVDFKVGRQRQLRGEDRARSTVAYSGVRPVLIIALTRDPKQGRRFTSALVEKLRADPTIQPGEMPANQTVHSVELAPLGVPGVTLGAPTKVQRGSGDSALDPLAWSEFRLMNAQSAQSGALAEVQCGNLGKAWLTAPISVIDGVAFDDHLTWSITAEGPKAMENLPDRVGQAKVGASSDDLQVFTSCAPLGLRAAPWTLQYRIMRHVTVDAESAKTQWWHEQSAPNAFEMPEKVFGLEEVVLTVLNDAVGKPVEVGRLAVCVRRVE